MTSMNFRKFATFCIAFVGSLSFGRALHLGWENAFYWATGWATISLSIHRVVSFIATFPSPKDPNEQASSQETRS